ncbi:MAG: pyrroloquinoline quinone biosynthesis protein PqqD [Hydrocarboniphaga sp.]|uniref:pyrroloquinoline quinone biosynthesis peptide chaperone PqqD n=1 Tax=Hydrocarboniphaga sp. TaxID=2033016 RepID=UPI002613AD37|nr:pyrroloquinoline quinone biosynthesis peptide chaperone PqqD [Hydrocarboniphaga sp.]MDB5972073.1 pyrroloquinoline quinone biosynthesis protein PqqD [Hydrocarboniphaga sp.]
MSAAIDAALLLDARPRIARGLRLQWEPAQDAHVLLYPEGMVQLNASAGEILKRCDGERDVTAIVAELEQAFEVEDLQQDVLAFLQLATAQRWIEGL